MEEIATINRIKAAAGGDLEALADLWDQYRPFIYQQAARRKAAASAGGYGWIVDVEDLAQAGYFALVGAAETYEPEKERAFITWLSMYLLNAFNDTLNVRTKRGRSDPIQAASSLDALLPEYDDTTLLDTIPDPADPFADLIAADYQRSICEMIRDAIEVIDTTDQIRRILKYMLEHNFTCEIFTAYQQTGGQRYGSEEQTKQRARNLYKQGIEKLRRELMKTGRKRLYKDYYFPAAYRSSFQSWEQTRTSAVEWSVLKRDQVLNRI